MGQGEAVIKGHQKRTQLYHKDCAHSHDATLERINMLDQKAEEQLISINDNMRN